MTYLNSMTVQTTMLALIIIISFSSPHFCPNSQFKGSVFSGQLIAAYNGGIIPFSEQSEIQCYDYVFPYQFTNEVDITISIHGFEAEYSDDLYFFIKPIQDEEKDSRTLVSFAIRTQWKYTQWSQISFSFLAQDHTDIESGYYQLDSGSLSGCHQHKSVQVLLPFSRIFNSGRQIVHKLFLHGFQIHTIKVGGTSSPYQIQVRDSIANQSGIIVSLQVTTVTEINSLYISFIAYQQIPLQIVHGSYLYKPVVESIPAYIPQNHIPKNYARIYGLTGFIINHHQGNVKYQTKWDGQNFNFQFGLSGYLVQYFTFQFIFFTGSSCSNCQNFPILHQGKCINYCPIDTYRTQKDTCISCSSEMQWNGTDCVKACPQGQYLNKILLKCECPPTLHWNGELCIPCLNGRVFIHETKSCECPRPLRWNGFTCAQIPDCTGGKIWDVYTYSCKCSERYYWELLENICKPIPTCKGGQVLDMYFKCICPTNYYWNDKLCVETNCFGGQVWNGAQCVCKRGSNFNGLLCIECINGQIWKSQVRKCDCQSGYKWNGNFCEVSHQCSANRVWNQTYQQCICPQKYHWSGYACLPVPQCDNGQFWNQGLQKCICSYSKHWNGKICVACLQGSVWNQQKLDCICPPGTIQLNSTCQIIQQCSNGKMWMQQLKSCECPIGTQWNGNFCISNPCSNGRIWSNEFKTCICPEFKIWNGQACVPPKISCDNGRIWDPTLYTCVCPLGTYTYGNTCESVPLCSNNTEYNPMNKKCVCKYGVKDINDCKQPSCSPQTKWNGYQCSIISCPPPSYYINGKCDYWDRQKCRPGYYWNGKECILEPSHCPSETIWKDLTCKPNGKCGEGFYLSSENYCIPFEQKCIPPTIWNGKQCSITNNRCPSGTFWNSGLCQPVIPCLNGYEWNKKYFKCECPQGTIQTGKNCIRCENQMIYSSYEGCNCPQGTFNSGSQCENITKQRCQNVPNSIWSGYNCVCREGFTKVGFQCVCYGVQLNNYCDKCSQKPFSEQINNVCKCKQGYTQINSICIPNKQCYGNDNKNQCNVGSYFNLERRMCLACPVGCLSCIDSISCKTCHPGFSFDYNTQSCIEHCGDGKRFVLDCDDNNNINGDGCSKDCRVETGFICKAGSPDSKDICNYYKPKEITLQLTGQIRTPSAILLNIKLDYLPKDLILSKACVNQCQKILLIDLVDGDRSVVSIQTKYIINTNYSFIGTLDFSRDYIGKFKCRIRINPEYAGYFNPVGIYKDLEIQINPAYLALTTVKDLIQ